MLYARISSAMLLLVLCVSQNIVLCCMRELVVLCFMRESVLLCCITCMWESIVLCCIQLRAVELRYMLGSVSYSTVWYTAFCRAMLYTRVSRPASAIVIRPKVLICSRCSDVSSFTNVSSAIYFTRKTFALSITSVSCTELDGIFHLMQVR